MRDISRSQIKRILGTFRSLKEVRGSGRGWSSKLDVFNKEVKIECKATSKMGFSIRRDLLEMWERQARKEGKYFAMILSFFPDGKDYLIVPIADIEEVVQALKE